MKRNIEILAPGGDAKAIKTAIYAGADAIFCGLNKFNARNRATNISFEDLQGILRLAHQHDCEIFLTLNIVILDSEIPALIKLLNRLVNTSIDGVIVQDLGLFHILNQHFPTLRVHASTQLNTHNEGQLLFLKSLHAERVNLSRELNINEIKDLTKVAHQEDLKIEVFVHGSYCISFSGQCYMSSLQNGNSGNRGQCSQPCRDRYRTTSAGREYPLNLKDNSAFLDLKELYDAGVDSLKIESRIKEFEYVYTVVNAWRKQVDNYTRGKALSTDKETLYKVFNRDFSNGFLKGKINKEMFIDNPMNHSIAHFSAQQKNIAPLLLEQKLQEMLQEKEALRNTLSQAIEHYDIAKLPLSIHITGKSGKPLYFSISTPDSHFELLSQSLLTDTGTEALTASIIGKRLTAIEDTEYNLEQLTIALEGEVYLPFKELTLLKKQLLCKLNDQRQFISPVTVRPLKKTKKKTHIPKLSIIISSTEELNTIDDQDCTIFYHLPNHLDGSVEDYLTLFSTHQELVPLFPAVLIGRDYEAAVQLLEQLKPCLLVTNNTGIGYEAYKRGWSWIAGAQLNLTNSYSLMALKKNFNCKGAFLSQELSKQQLLGIKKPEDFELYYTIYQPLLLMTSRQCFFHQVNTCTKHLIENSCITDCEKKAHITNLKEENYIIEKSKGNYHRIYNESPLLNTELAHDIGDRFTSLVVDINPMTDDSTLHVEKDELIKLFKRHLAKDADATQRLQEAISPSNNTSYTVGV